MNLPFRLNIFWIFLLALTACTPPSVSAKNPNDAINTPDKDAVNLIYMEKQAEQIAQKSQGEVLREVDTDLTTIDFRFVDRALTKEVIILVPEPNAPTENWTATVNTVSPLLTYTQPAMDLHSLRIGPGRVAQAITNHWPGCGVRGMNLYLEQGKLTWLAFCNTPSGVVSGSMDNESGIFQPANSPPASIPSVATREP